MTQMNLKKYAVSLIISLALLASQVKPQAIQSTISSVQSTPCLYNGDYFPTGQWYSISVNHSGKCISSTSDQFLRQTTCNQWDFTQSFSIIPLGGCLFTFAIPSGSVIDNKDSGLTDGNAQWMVPSNGSSAQIFKIDGSSKGWKIINTGNNKCLDLVGGSTADGVQFFQNTCSTSPSQQFTLKLQPSTTVMIQSVKSGLCLSIQDIVRNYACNSRDRNQQWTIGWSNGFYIGLSVLNNMLDNRGSTYQVTNLYAGTQNGTNNQNYWFELLSDGNYAIRSVTSGMCLDVYGGYTDAGVNIIQYNCHYEGNQRWRFLPVLTS